MDKQVGSGLHRFKGHPTCGRAAQRDQSPRHPVCSRPSPQPRIYIPGLQRGMAFGYSSCFLSYAKVGEEAQGRQGAPQEAGLLDAPQESKLSLWSGQGVRCEKPHEENPHSGPHTGKHQCIGVQGTRLLGAPTSCCIYGLHPGNAGLNTAAVEWSGCSRT